MLCCGRKKSKEDLPKHLYATCLSPPIPTFNKAINNNNFLTWPGLSSTLVSTHLPKSTFTFKGHMKLEKQDLQSTKNLTNSTAEDVFPVSDQPKIKTNQRCYTIIDPSNISGAYVDLTGQFPKRSSRGNGNVLACYHYDSNYTHGITLKYHKGKTTCDAWK